MAEEIAIVNNSQRSILVGYTRAKAHRVIPKSAMIVPIENAHKMRVYVPKPRKKKEKKNATHT